MTSLEEKQLLADIEKWEELGMLREPIPRPIILINEQDCSTIFWLLRVLMKEVSILNQKELELYHKIKPYLPKDYIGMIEDLEKQQKENGI